LALVLADRTVVGRRIPAFLELHSTRDADEVAQRPM
jgi:hypothetical protein